jgi:SAM-dependent methyltransferase
LSDSQIVSSRKSQVTECDQKKGLSGATKASCPSCLSTNIFIFYELDSIPVQSVPLIPDKKTALNYPKGMMSMAFCQTCGFIHNASFDENLVEYSTSYEATQAFSPTFSTFAHDLANSLIDRYDLHEKTILEIGCGKGEFLVKLCEMGNNCGIGFDPVFSDNRVESETTTNITFIQDYYSEKYAEYKADFICCKMTLEHIHHTYDFIKTVRRAIGEQMDTIVFFQIPEATRILKNCAFEDIYYEHCSYFSPGALARLFRSCDFDVLKLDTEYDGQYLVIEAKPASQTPSVALPLEDDLETLKTYVKSFDERCREKIAPWKDRINKIRNNGQRAVVWGSTSKGVAYLTTLKIEDEIQYVVDINPYRQGFFMPVTGQKIVSPEFLREYKPDLVIAMNAIYVEEIKRDLKQLCLSPEIIAL